MSELWKKAVAGKSETDAPVVENNIAEEIESQVRLRVEAMRSDIKEKAKTEILRESTQGKLDSRTVKSLLIAGGIMLLSKWVESGVIPAELASPNVVDWFFDILQAAAMGFAGYYRIIATKFIG